MNVPETPAPRLARLLPLLLLVLGACAAPPPPAPSTTPADTLAFRPRRDPVAARRSWEEGRKAASAGRAAEAESWYGRAVALDPADPTYLHAWAESLVALGRLTDAVDPMRRAIEAQEAAPEPNHRLLVVDYDRLIRLLERLGRDDEALRARARQERHRELRDLDVP